MHGVFDIIGPVMIGPSSSHTAGAVRLGRMAFKILGEPAVKAEISLSGSFAKTGRGHGTDKALIAGIMGFLPDDERIRNALEIAKRHGLDYSFESVNIRDAHPNTAKIYLIGVTGRTAKLIGASIGGGNIRVTNIDGYDVDITGQYPVLVTIHRDRPGVITQVTSILAKYEVNIAFMHVSRQSRGETAMMIMELDETPTDEVVEACQEVYEVRKAFSIPAVL
ncbi:MAG: L-serine ammonia-lyase, iron-sulfur-dependent subunit beta [Veillonellaceae bacterium]|nr:L-serine ammonia-lyase, iron-sulfur-dependent subunit beta [Veillonellaceae bacterium]MDD6923761.1 L-serine ammonia-lyase, iron-sulfur-dependent subunit beta [Veillonellaceae bacterium]